MFVAIGNAELAWAPFGRSLWTLEQCQMVMIRKQETLGIKQA